MKFRELMESLQGDFQIRIRKAQKGEAGEIMKEIEAAFKDKKINEKEFDMLTAMCGRQMDHLGEAKTESYNVLYRNFISALNQLFNKVDNMNMGGGVSSTLETFKKRLEKEDKDFRSSSTSWALSESEDLGESEDKKIQKAATKLVIKMKKDGEENKKIIKALTINFPSINALRFLADFKNELVEDEETGELDGATEELDEATYYTLDKHSNGYNALFSVEKTIHDLLTTIKNGNDFSMNMWNDIKKLLSKVEKDIKENR